MRSNHQYNKFSFIIPFSDASVTSFQVYGFHNCNQQSVLQHVHYFQDDIWAQLLHKLHRLQSKNYNDHKSYRNTFPQNAAHNVSPLDLTKEERNACFAVWAGSRHTAKIEFIVIERNIEAKRTIRLLLYSSQPVRFKYFVYQPQLIAFYCCLLIFTVVFREPQMGMSRA